MAARKKPTTPPEIVAGAGDVEDLRHYVERLQKAAMILDGVMQAKPPAAPARITLKTVEQRRSGYGSEGVETKSPFGIVLNMDENRVAHLDAEACRSTARMLEAMAGESLETQLRRPGPIMMMAEEPASSIDRARAALVMIEATAEVHDPVTADARLREIAAMARRAMGKG